MEHLLLVLALTDDQRDFVIGFLAGKADSGNEEIAKALEEAAADAEKYA